MRDDTEAIATHTDEPATALEMESSMPTPVGYTALLAVAQRRASALMADVDERVARGDTTVIAIPRRARHTVLDVLTLALYALAHSQGRRIDEVELADLAWAVHTEQQWRQQVQTVLMSAGHAPTEEAAVSDPVAARWAGLLSIDHDGYNRLDRWRVDAADVADQALADQHRVHTPPAEADAQWTVFGTHVRHSSPWGRYGTADLAKPAGERFKHEWCELSEAAMTVAVRDGHVLMAWRHRWVPNLWSWELPGGLVGTGESPSNAAGRELIEETGWAPTGELEHLATYEPAAGSLAAAHHVYLAAGVEHRGDPTEHDEGRFRWLPLESMPDRIAAGELGTSGSLIGILQTLRRL